jgi:hypothetical protein
MVFEGYSGRYLQKRQENQEDTSTYCVGDVTLVGVVLNVGFKWCTAGTLSTCAAGTSEGT